MCFTGVPLSSHLLYVSISQITVTAGFASSSWGSYLCSN